MATAKTYYHTIPKSRFIFGGDKDNKNGLAGKIIYFAGGKYVTESAAEQAELDAAIRSSGGAQLSCTSAEELTAKIHADRKAMAAAPEAPVATMTEAEALKLKAEALKQAAAGNTAAVS